MIRKIFSRFLFVGVVCLGVLFTLALDSYTSDADVSPDFDVNDNGQTYGSAILSEYEAAIFPDLILAEGIDGTEGFVLKEDLEGTGPLDKPRNPEEAMIYMQLLDDLIAETEARAALHNLESHEIYLYYIPLYASDGVTVIGEFGISISNSNETSLDLD